MASTSHRVASSALSAVAVLAAHEVAYRIVAPGAHERAQVLHDSGHGWWAAAPFLVGAALGIAAVAVGCAEGARRVRWALGPLAATAYVAIEVAERAVGGGHHHGGADLATLGIGAALALVFGLAAAVLLDAGERFVARATTRRVVVVGARVTRIAAVAGMVRPRRIVAFESRGPPLGRWHPSAT